MANNTNVQQESVENGTVTRTDTDADGIMPHLTAFQRDALVVLAGGASHGLGIKAALEDYYDAEVNHGRLYPNLDDLAARGLVDKERGSPDARSNEYSLTARGRAALRAHRDWEEQYLGGDA